MKRCLILCFLLLSIIGVKAQQVDSAFLADMQQTTKILPRYKMYKTENNFILLKMDTRTGKVWMTQFRSGSTQNMEIPVSYYVIEREHDSWNGRFEMYATNNIYKFIIVDTYLGDTYLLQWNSEYDKRFIEKIVN